ncbi:MAG: arginine repressor [Clostridiales Family XIII bacterium]|jgi:transcriptional regulator of arginine metabolism|nr:arginine repressor [Clostridiales Family XIII bacterium]
MRYTRQNKIIDLIAEHEVDTQERLAELLEKAGYEVTQATVSRDIKELRLVKSLASSGNYKYSLPEGGGERHTDRYLKIFGDTVRSAKHSGNMIVIKTLTGCANAACEAIDSLDFPHILGTIAGDSTIFIIVDDAEQAPLLSARFAELILK